MECIIQSRNLTDDILENLVFRWFELGDLCHDTESQQTVFVMRISKAVHDEIVIAIFWPIRWNKGSVNGYAEKGGVIDFYPVAQTDKFVCIGKENKAKSLQIEG